MLPNYFLAFELYCKIPSIVEIIFTQIQANYTPPYNLNVSKSKPCVSQKLDVLSEDLTPKTHA